MAITIVKNLTQNYFYPSANEILITANSNNTGKCNFRYICDIYINSIKVHTLKTFPDPTTGYGLFNLQRICEDYIETVIDKSAATHAIVPGTNTSAPNAAFSLQVKFGEEYDNTLACDGVVNQYLNLLNSNTAYVFEGGIDYEYFTTYSSTYSVVGTFSNPSKFLTNAPRELTLTYNDQFCLDFLTLQNINVADWKLDIKTYDNTNTLINTYSYPTNKTHLIRRMRLFCGPYDINRIANTTIINPVVKRYTVQLRYSTSTLVSEVFTFNLKNPEAFQSRFCFTGQLGSPELYTFYHRKRTLYNINRNNYTKVLSPLNTQYTLGDRGSQTYQITGQERGTVGSYIREADAKWLTELPLSKDIFILQRPELMETQLVATASGTATFLYKKPKWATGIENEFVVGNSVFLHQLNGTQSGKYTITNIPVENQITISGTFSGTPCGFLQKDTTWRKLPIVATDNTVEVFQRLGSPILYQFNWETAYQKTTLRG